MVHNHDCIYELLRLGAKTYVPNCDGATPPSLAVMVNDFLLLGLFLRAGANPNAIACKTEEPQTALDIACGDYCVQDTTAEELNIDAIVELLKQYGGKGYREQEKEKNSPTKNL